MVTPQGEASPGNGLRRFEGRRVLVTGASRGIGAATCERLAAEGAHVAMVARTSEPGGPLGGSLAETAGRIARHGGRVTVIAADLADPDDRRRVVADAVTGLGGHVEVLVNNAAAALYGPLATLPLRRRQVMFEVNVHAPLDLAQQVIPPMLDAGEGWIVNVSSRAARHWEGPPFALGANGTTIAAYGASKAALDRITNGLGAELAESGIRVISVAPRAAVRSEGAEALVGSTLRADQVEPMEHMVEAVVALCACPSTETGGTLISGDLLGRLGLAVRTLDGVTEID